MYCLICFMLEITLDVLQLKRYYCNFDVYRSYDELHCWIEIINIFTETIKQILKFDHIWCLPLIICSFCMELKLFFMLIQLVLKLCDFFLKQWKTLNNCKHDVYCSFWMELDLFMQFIALHFMWDTQWIPTWMKYRVSQVSRVSEYMCIFLWS